MCKIKILFVIGQLSTGGTEIQLLQLIKHLDEREFEVRVVCLSGTEITLAGKFAQAGFPPILLSKEEKSRVITLWRLAQIIEEYKPDIVHAFSYASRAGILAAKRFGHAKVIVSFRNDPKRWITTLDRLIINSADLILENSNYAIRSYGNLNRRMKPKTKVIFNGIDIEAFDLASKREIMDPVPGTYRTGRAVVCTVMRLIEQKRVDHLLVAFSLLLKERSDIDLWIVGEGDLREELEALSRALKIQDQVSFWGIRSDVASILRHANLGVQSSEYEGLPNSIIEYMTAGLPVVATNVRGTNELVISGKTGLLVPFGDHQAFADAMLHVLQNPAVAQSLGQAGRHHIEQFYTLERMVSETELAYADLITDRQI